jgi:hypothetical protein
MVPGGTDFGGAVGGAPFPEPPVCVFCFAPELLSDADTSVSHKQTGAENGC